VETDQDHVTRRGTTQGGGESIVGHTQCIQP